MFVFVELTALNYIDAAFPVFLQLFSSVNHPFLDVVETIASTI